jgi:hypothetical protein
MSELCVGVMAGVITTALLCIVSVMFRAVITPWVSSLLYSGPDISGDWSGHDDQSPKAQQVSSAHVTQKGAAVAIDIERFKRRSDHSPCKRRLHYKGRLTAGTLITLYEDVEMKGFIVGTMVMSLSTDGKMLSGKVVYYDKNVSQVVAPDYFLRRPT